MGETKKPARVKKEKPQKVFQAPKGMHDIFGKDTELFDGLRQTAASCAAAYGYQYIELPVIEDRDLFVRSVGVGTDIVDKEMYTLKTQGGDMLALRPEFTAGIARAYMQNGMQNMPQPVKIWAWGPAFRHDNPQAGRYRQFWQADFEFFGADHPVADAEVIQLAVKLAESYGIKDICVYVNSIGCTECRGNYRKALKTYYRSKSRKLCPDCKRRLSTNVLRLLDCKNESCMLIKKEAPETTEYLCKNCSDHFKKVLTFLDEAKIGYFLDPYLVRGLDYYNRTVFELKSAYVPPQPAPAAGEVPALPAEQKEPLSFGGGGRYDYLMKMLGGPDTPAVGFALGVDRMVELTREEKLKNAKSEPNLYLVQIGDAARMESLRLIEELRSQNVKVFFDLSRDSLKAQLRSADREQSAYALIIGQKEVLDQEVILRDMQTGIQESIPYAKLIETVKARMKQKTKTNGR